MRVDGNLGAHTNYYPNSYDQYQDDPSVKQPPLEVDGPVYEHNFREDDDQYYEQPGKLFNLQSDEDKQHLFKNTAAEIGAASDRVKHRHIFNCYQADPAYGRGVADALGINIDDVELKDKSVHLLDK